MCGRAYVILYFDPHVFLCSLRLRPRPKLHSTETSGLAIITRITLGIELFTALNSFAGAVKTQKIYGSSISIWVSGSGKLIRYCHSYKPPTIFTWKFIVHYTNHEGSLA